MKLITILLIIGAAVLCEAQYEWCRGDNLRTIIGRCALYYGATQADIDDFMTMKWASSARVKCFRACAFHGCRVFTSDGRLKSITSGITTVVLWGRDPYRARVIEHTANNCLYTLPRRRNTCETAEWYLRCLTLNSPVQLSFVGTA